MLRQAKEKALKGFSVIIFPEGTRKGIGEKPNYKSGFVGIYKEMKTRILPVALNSGKCWPKHTFVKQSGKIVIKFLPLIDSELPRKKVLSEVETKIEIATNKII